jgi:hypothetical protein
VTNVTVMTVNNNPQTATNVMTFVGFTEVCLEF